MADTIYPGNATPAQVLSGQKFSAGANYNTAGTMPDNGQKIITPGTAQQSIPQGYHDGTGYVQGDPNLVAANILAGISIFGVAGTVGRSASGSVTNDASTISLTPYGYQAGSMYTVTVSGLTFQPKRIVLVKTSSTTNGATTIYDADDNAINGDAGTTILCTSLSATDYAYAIQTGIYVNATGFKLPVFQTGTYKWYAYEN